ncbi:secreted RxLR effector peptide protein, putative [Phytophthora infestans T30-4]|uniref:RxLR effector protein n=3 Tax=Phytophthora infestans TaxID=4787 RepID=D0NTV4_PHYIT|nr:secreted RxLR effector peptide protein, putative [Phytophthora infestans T30-4]EEY65066.1 secreted RxLR effector peptide protein, putative [Phytophthora infestans T30-4]KAF4035382.1 hypothetical protein GN244_ATG12596 [Phytophthora infestans]|eukprot:XP_002897554.1 secreted RxLR effector peptide protein, putative [Phytophthora infestans T30-4]
MRSYILLVAIMIVCSSAASVNLRHLHLIKAVHPIPGSERLLRAEKTNDKTESTEDEERAGLTDFVKKLGTGASKRVKDTYLASKLKAKASQMNLDTTVQKLVDDRVHPDRVYKVLNLQKPQNRFVGVDYSGRMKLWMQLTDAWKVKYPGTKTQLK